MPIAITGWTESPTTDHVAVHLECLLARNGHLDLRVGNGSGVEAAARSWAQQASGDVSCRIYAPDRRLHSKAASDRDMRMLTGADDGDQRATLLVAFVEPGRRRAGSDVWRSIEQAVLLGIAVEVLPCPA